jgi:hypothetical protein
LYVDGKLDASGYMMTPAYQATNYVRIGCYNTTGSNSLWFNGQIDDLFLINGYALDEKYIAAKYAAATAQGTSDLTLTKYFLTSIDSTYSNPSTTVTLYGGTDYTLSNSAITNVYYSPQKAPYGFPLNPAKWTVTAAISTDQTQSSPTSGTWYNLGGSISVPIGMWEKRYSILGLATKTTMSGQIQATLSRANNTASNPEMSASSYIDAISAAFGAQLIATGNESFSAKTTLYLNLKTVITSATSLINYAGTGVPSIVTVRSTLL